MRVKSNQNKYEYEVNGAKQSYDVCLKKYTSTYAI